MEPVYVPLAVKNAGLSLHGLIPSYVASPAPLAMAVHVARLFRRVAIGSMLMAGVPEEFFLYLFHSSRSFLHFLERAPDGEKATSKAEPLFDAIACGDDDGARRIARASRLAWNPDEEYEDDFLYAHFVIERFFRGAEATRLRAVLQRYEEVLDGQKDVRLDLCRAVLEVNQTAFHAAIERFIEERMERLEELRASERLNPEDASTTAVVSTELLAWLRLAEMVGLRTQSSYRFAPDIARLLTRSRPPAPAAWQALDPLLELD